MLGKLKTIFIIMLMVFSVPAMAFAVDDNAIPQTYVEDGQDDGVVVVSAPVEDEVEVDTQEAEILSDATGAEIRLLQLKNRIEIQIDGANLILDRIVDNINNNSEAIDTPTLERIVADLEGLSIRIDELDMNQEADVLAQEFVAIRAEAIALTKEFRTQLKDKLNEKREEIRARIQERKNEALNKKNDRIEKLKKSYKINKAKSWSEALGLDVDEIKAKVESGEMTPKEVGNMLKNKFKSLSDDDKKEALLKVREEKQKLRVQVEAKREELKAKAKVKREEFKAIAEQRREEFRSRVEEKREEFKERAEQRREEFNHMDNDLENVEADIDDEFVEGNDLEGDDSDGEDEFAQMNVSAGVSN